jgi:hypothetical protein
MIATDTVDVVDHFIANLAAIIAALAALVAAISSLFNHQKLHRVNERTKKIAEAVNGSANPQDKPKNEDSYFARTHL